MKTKLIVGSVCVACAVVGIALATPTIGAFYNVILSTGTANQDIHAHAHVALPGSEDGFSAELETEGAANFIVQEVKFSPGGTTGWHGVDPIRYTVMTLGLTLNCEPPPLRSSCFAT
jgi:hypothetical protein